MGSPETRSSSRTSIRRARSIRPPTAACSRSTAPRAGASSLTRTLAERLEARGLRLAAVSSGSTGSALLTNPRAPAGVGVLVNGYLDPGQRVAWPDDVSAAILAKFGPAPPKGRGAERYDAAVTWTQRVLREYVLPELAPAVVINWITEPDHTQHTLGVGSPAAREALRHADREIAQVLAALDGLGLAASTDVFVASDHGFTTNTAGVDVARELIDAGLKAERGLRRRGPGEQRAGGRAARGGARPRTDRAHRALRPVARLGRRALHRRPGGGRPARRSSTARSRWT